MKLDQYHLEHVKIRIISRDGTFEDVPREQLGIQGTKFPDVLYREDTPPGLTMMDFLVKPSSFIAEPRNVARVFRRRNDDPTIYEEK